MASGRVGQRASVRRPRWPGYRSTLSGQRGWVRWSGRLDDGGRRPWHRNHRMTRPPASSAAEPRSDIRADRPGATSASLLERLGDYRVLDDDDDDPVLVTKDGQPVDTWREGYPYQERMSRARLRAREAAAPDRAAQAAELDQGLRRAAGGAVRGARRRRQGRHHQAVHGAPQPPRGRGSWRWRSPASGSRPSGTSSATSRTCRPPARSCCSTGPGTTGPASSG